MKIHHIAITVSNLEESIKFYTQILGFKVGKQFSKERKGVLASATYVKLGDFQIELWQFPDMKENQDALSDIKIKGIKHIAFEVDNLNKTISKLEGKGLKLTKPQLGASGHNYSFTTDPDGVALEFYEK